jgi:hypothetical protein
MRFQTHVFSSEMCVYCKKSEHVKGIVSPDWKGLQMVSLDRFEV